MPATDPQAPAPCAAHGNPACPACTAALAAEFIAVRDRYYRLLTTQSQFERDVRAAAWRAALDAAHAFGDMWAQWRCADAMIVITAVCHQVRQYVPEGGGRISRAAAERLHIRVRLAEAHLREQQAPVTFTTEAARAEVIRLRQLIVTEGQKLHADSQSNSPPCRCPGCELIRSMDDVAIPGAPPWVPQEAPADAGPSSEWAPAPSRPGTKGN